MSYWELLLLTQKIMIFTLIEKKFYLYYFLGFIPYKKVKKGKKQYSLICYYN